MINLELLDACQNCPNLEPIKTNEFDAFYQGDIQHHITISCENIEKCRALLKHLQKEVEKHDN